MTNSWDKAALESRIADPEKRKRHEAGSPNLMEVELYRSCIRRFLEPQARMDAVVLGMTPELRVLLLEMNVRVTAVDNNPESIRIYRDWVPFNKAAGERIIQADWFELPQVLTEMQDVIVGDGIFGNIPSVEGHERLLNLFWQLLKPGGGLVLRHCLIPSNFISEEFHYRHLCQQFRDGRLSPAEYGFAMRIFGLFDEAYDGESYLLDNKIVFERYEEIHRMGELSDLEYAAIRNYLFLGKNLFLPQEKWEALLRSVGFEFESHVLKGKHWYDYYFIYSCQKSGRPFIVGKEVSE